MRFLLGFVLAAALVCAAYVGSALVGIDTLTDAVRAGDAGAVIARTDVARLRASLTGQIAETVLEVEGNRRVLSPLERSLIGGAVATVADEIVAFALEPPVLTEVLRSGRFRRVAGFQLAAIPSLTSIDASRVGDILSRVRLYRVNEFALRLSSDTDPETTAAIRLRFSAFGWKLSAIELPRRALREIAQNVRRR